MNVLFLGTPEFALPSLALLTSSKHNIVGVISQPDRKTDRKGRLLPTPVKEYAQSLGLPVYQFKSVNREGIDLIKSLNPDVAVTAAFGQLLSCEFLSIPKYGVINVHASLLPKYRGAAPIQWSVINGETQTGVTIMRTNEGMDTGDIISQTVIPIPPDATSGDMFEKLSVCGASLLISALEDIENGTAVYTPQNNALATKCSLINKSMCELNFSDKAQNVVNLIRGLNPAPVAYTFINGEQTKIFTAKVAFGSGKPGEVLNSQGSLIVACGEGAIEILTLQAPGKHKVSSHDYLLGRKIEVGSILGR